MVQWFAWTGFVWIDIESKPVFTNLTLLNVEILNGGFVRQYMLDCYNLISSVSIYRLVSSVRVLSVRFR